LSKPPSSHYFSKKPTSDIKLKKIFESIGTHTLTLNTSSGVFSPGEIDKGTLLLIQNLILPGDKILNEKPSFLEIGGGYGPISIWLHKELDSKAFFSGNKNNAKIFVSEINERALWLLRKNLKHNDCNDIIILKGNFLDQIKDLQSQNIRFQAIYTNPPLKVGHETMLELFHAAMNLLSPTGFIQYVHKKKLGAEAFLEKLKKLKPSWNYNIMKKRGGYHIIVISPIEFITENDTKGRYF
jgi:16S rRNA (guanine1207-N2)-methyltransferase